MQIDWKHLGIQDKSHSARLEQYSAGPTTQLVRATGPAAELVHRVVGPVQ